jgi:hypothetical protein
MRALVASLTAAWLLHTPAARGEQPPERAAEEADALERAKELFRRGMKLYQVGDIERALHFFLRSRQARPSIQNTSNAANMLARLGRYDEALELYEEVLLKFDAELTDGEKAAIGPTIEKLNTKVARIDISANVDGMVIIDGRARGRLPLEAPVRVLVGERTVRVIKDGYASYTKKVSMSAGQLTRIVAELRALAATGGLRVEDPGHESAQVYVDGAPMGPAPWEGTLGPGTHLVWTKSSERGSAPRAATVLQGQTVLVRVRSGRLGAPLRIDAVPRSANIRIGGAGVGKGAYRDRLPVGRYRVHVSEEGYRERTVDAVVTEDDAPPLRVELEVDADHPRWPKALAGKAVLTVFGGAALSPSLESEALENCEQCPDGATAIGPFVGVRGGYRFPFGMGLELAGGYLQLGARSLRTMTLPHTGAAQYQLEDDILLHGPFAAVGVSYRHAVGRAGPFARVMAGGFFATARDFVRGNVAAGGTEQPIEVLGSNERISSPAVMLVPELGVDVELGGLQLGGSVGVIAIVTEGARLESRSIAIEPNCDPNRPELAGCTPTGAELPNERAHGVFFAVTPQLFAGYTF